MPSKDDLEALFKTLTIAGVAGGLLPLVADYHRLSPRVADLVGFGDFLRALPHSLAAIWYFGLLCVAAYALLVSFLKNASARTRFRAFGVALTLFVGLGLLHRHVEIAALVDLRLAALLVLFSGALATGAGLLAFEDASGALAPGAAPILAAALFAGAGLWLYATWFPLDAPHDPRDEICVEDGCRPTQILRFYGDWLVHREAPDRLVFTRIDDVVGFSSPAR